MKLLRGEDTAILLISEIARHGEVVPLSEIAFEHGVSQLYLKKLARQLRLSGLITSKEGVGGGYCLNMPAEKISVLDVINSVNATPKIPRVVAKRTSCPLATVCLPETIRQRIFRVLESGLGRLTVADLFGGKYEGVE